MKARLIVWLLLGVSAALAAVPACANPGDGGGGEGGGHRFRHRFLRAGEAGPGPVVPAAERADGGPEFRRGEMPMFRRMSPEERRQLRRDIRSAGDDLYRRPPPPPPPFEPPGR
jgi:hypothetical protein